MAASRHQECKIVSNCVVASIRADAGAGLEPLDLTMVKKWLKMESISDDDDLIEALITQAREWIEAYTGILLIAREVTAILEIINDIELPYGPISGDVTVSQNDEPVATPNIIGPDGSFKRLRGYGQYSATYIGGYNIVPSALMLAMKQYISYTYEHRGDGLDESTKEYAYEAKRTAFPYRRNLVF